MPPVLVVNVPLLMVNVFEPNAPLLPTLNMPADSVVPVECVLTPVRINVPAPDLVRRFAPATIPLNVNVLVLSTFIVPPPVPSAMPRLLFKVNVSLAISVPPDNVNWPAVAEPGAAPHIIRCKYLRWHNNH